jgi:hypothetical protein
MGVTGQSSKGAAVQKCFPAGAISIAKQAEGLPLHSPHRSVQTGLCRVDHASAVHHESPGWTPLVDEKSVIPTGPGRFSVGANSFA